MQKESDNIYLDPEVVSRLPKAHYSIPEPVLLEFSNIILSTLIKDFPSEQRYLILEMGIGTGKTGIPMALQGGKYNATVYGFDNSRAMISILHKLVTQKMDIPNLKYILADAESPYLSFRDNTFHACSLVYFLHHILDWQKCLEEALRVLKPNGVIVFAKEVSQWTYFIDANFSLTELENPHELLFRFWSYYHQQRDSIVEIPFKSNTRLFSATNYTNVFQYLQGKGMSAIKIQKNQKMRWKRKFDFKTILEIIKHGDYPPLALGLTKSQMIYLANTMQAFLIHEEVDINEEIVIDSWIETCLLKE